jgi:hypothetical protein
VSAEYQEGYHQAILTFRHQTVFDPRTGRTVPLTPYTVLSGAAPSTCDDMSFVGPLIPDEIARGIAVGVLHPSTKAPFAKPVLMPVTGPGRPVSGSRQASMFNFVQSRPQTRPAAPHPSATAPRPQPSAFACTFAAKPLGPSSMSTSSSVPVYSRHFPSNPTVETTPAVNLEVPTDKFRSFRHPGTKPDPSPVFPNLKRLNSAPVTTSLDFSRFFASPKPDGTPVKKRAVGDTDGECSPAVFTPTSLFSPSPVESPCISQGSRAESFVYDLEEDVGDVADPGPSPVSSPPSSRDEAQTETRPPTLANVGTPVALSGVLRTGEKLHTPVSFYGSPERPVPDGSEVRRTPGTAESTEIEVEESSEEEEGEDASVTPTGSPPVRALPSFLSRNLPSKQSTSKPGLSVASVLRNHAGKAASGQMDTSSKLGSSQSTLFRFSRFQYSKPA